MQIKTFKGVLLEERKNRFLCDCLIGEEIVECYIPSSARLSNFFDVHNCPVLLTENQGKKTRTRYKVFAIWQKDEWVLVNLTFINNLMIEYFEKDPSIVSQLYREKTIAEGYKSDVFIDACIPRIIELKAILSDQESAVFPTVTGERSLKQLRLINKLLKKATYEVEYGIVLLNKNITKVCLTKADKSYRRIMKQCIKNGLQVRFYRVTCDENQANLDALLGIGLE